MQELIGKQKNGQLTWCPSFTQVSCHMNICRFASYQNECFSPSDKTEGEVPKPEEVLLEPEFCEKP